MAKERKLQLHRQENFEMIEMEARRERVKMNVALLKKEEEEKRSTGGGLRQSKNIGKDGSPDLNSFIQQFPGASFDNKGTGNKEVSDTKDGVDTKDRSTEPSGSGESFKPGTWQPPT
ncbi:mimitin, mitochondrial isoform X2 [Iris pallida]|uniref:Mimitin, mitochondrial isoform X2 n=1 Tax=Iris pallida TaxID=29817 RepID=A0AAX6HB35_IRIPA|nr:mimitin, mitochondrial isoform X2 [Iris pallida]KAJ6849331.1 mimitin, mitochondrial isoform X2 [Iris pallida]